MIIDHPRPEQIRGLRQLWQEAFGDTDAFLDTFFDTAFSPNRCFCASDRDVPVSALYWFDCTCREKKVAYLYAVATDIRYRGQGLCRQLMEHTHAHLKRLGYAGAILVPGSKELFRFYEKLDYRTCVFAQEDLCTPGTAPARLENLNALDYARLRKAYLPEGSVIQEGENLAFLEKQVRFYKGDGFLLAAARQGTNLYTPELLGNTAAAGSILCALGCTVGTFRGPGGDIPFAMYRPFTPDPAPGWFGFAFN